ncbi:spermine/spermidine synthase [Histoplasma ohiense]|nr:spermine/spermidine synthase [Histoplasma ohiense (nom. inval.)]
MPSKKSLSRGGRSSQRAESEQKPTPQPQKVNENQLVSTPKTIKLIGLAALLLALTATYSPISQLTLSPVYGSVPSVVFHQRGMMVAALCGWFGKDQIRKRLSIKVMNFLPVLALGIPTIQFFLFQWSEQLGAVYGPFLTELLTYFPLVFLSVASVTMLLEDAGLKRYSETLGNHGPFFGSYILFSTLQKFIGFLLPRYIGHNALIARAPLQLIAASLYAISLPSKWLLLALPSVLFSARYNVHFPFEHNTALLNSTLQGENFVLLHREESLTGYLSVLENVKEHYRVMRCDHSLLGGEWTQLPNAQFPEVREPIYSIFTMLEAVRLIKSDDGSSRRGGPGTNSLVIGLGIGTTPTALVNHGIDTTVVEIDPAVYHIAADYFSIPKNFTPVIQDAVRFVDEATRATPAPRFDFIVHDVFTGGVEPINLFTVEFMKGLSALLKEDGVIAINYAGDLSLPSSGLIVRTIKSVFPSCRIFRESEPPADTREGDFTNMVIFCKQTDSPLEFRNPTEADFLGSKSRESYLLPQYEINAASFAKPEEDQQDILAVGHAGNLVRWHSQSAAGHWKIMRTVLPAFVWENW